MLRLLAVKESSDLDKLFFDCLESVLDGCLLSVQRLSSAYDQKILIKALRDTFLDPENWEHRWEVLPLNAEDPLQPTPSQLKGELSAINDLTVQQLETLESFVGKRIVPSARLYSGKMMSVGYDHWHFDHFDNCRETQLVKNYYTLSLFPDGVQGGTRYLELPNLKASAKEALVKQFLKFSTLDKPDFVGALYLQCDLLEKRCVMSMLGPAPMSERFLPFVKTTQSGVVYKNLVLLFPHTSPPRTQYPRVHYVMHQEVKSSALKRPASDGADHPPRGKRVAESKYR